MGKRPHVPPLYRWQMAPSALIGVNVGLENASPFVKLRIYRSVQLNRWIAKSSGLENKFAGVVTSVVAEETL